jgi:hypothetical protein
MVARRVRDHAGTQVGVGARKDGVVGPARLEGAHLLQVLALEMQVRAALLVDQRVLDHGGAQHTAGNAVLGGTDVVECHIGLGHG